MNDQIEWQKHVIKDELSSDVKERKMTEQEKAWMEELKQQRKFKRGPRRRANHTWPKRR
ncbi:hypothetical protein [Salibacterium aidingense]|uniref:hypothetical protein n=1 Tax=Salibacterium aidingense TaxID=384933 RepID=UPI003BD2C757